MISVQVLTYSNNDGSRGAELKITEAAQVVLLSEHTARKVDPEFKLSRQTDILMASLGTTHEWTREGGEQSRARIHCVSVHGRGKGGWWPQILPFPLFHQAGGRQSWPSCTLQRQKRGKHVLTHTLDGEREGTYEEGDGALLAIGERVVAEGVVGTETSDACCLCRSSRSLRIFSRTSSVWRRTSNFSFLLSSSSFFFFISSMVFKVSWVALPSRRRASSRSLFSCSHMHTHTNGTI